MTTPPAKSVDRRSSKRKRPNGLARVECRRGTMGFGRNLAIRLLDVSESGARMLVREPLRVGDEVEIIFLAFSKKIRREGAVYRADPEDERTTRVGVRFRHRLHYGDLQTLT